MTHQDIGNLVAFRLRQGDVRTKKQKADYEDALIRAAEEIKRLNNENEELHQFKVNAETKLAIARSEAKAKVEKFRSRVNTMEKNLKGIAGDMNYLKSQRSEWNASISETKRDLNELKGNGRSEQAAVTKLQTELGKVDTNRKNLGDRVEELVKELYGQFARNQDLQQKVDEKSAQLTEERNSKLLIEQRLHNTLNTGDQLVGRVAGLEKKFDDITTGIMKELDSAKQAVQSANKPQEQYYQLLAQNQILQANAAQRDELVAPEESQNMLEPSSPSRPNSHASEIDQATRPSTTSNQANMKSKIARSPRGEVTAEEVDDVASPFFSVRERTPIPSRTQAHDRRLSAERHSSSRSSHFHTPPPPPRRKRTSQQVNNSSSVPVKRLKLSASKRGKSYKMSPAAISKAFRDGLV